MDIQILGANQLAALARACRQAGREDLNRELVDGLAAAARRLEPAIRREVPPTMPAGYEATLSASVRARVNRRLSGSGAGVRIVVDAKGPKRLRALPAIDAGILRHPVYGRMRRTRRGWRPNPWVAQPVRPGVVTRPFERLEPAILDQLGRAIDRVASKIAAG